MHGRVTGRVRGTAASPGMMFCIGISDEKDRIITDRIAVELGLFAVLWVRNLLLSPATPIPQRCAEQHSADRTGEHEAGCAPNRVGVAGPILVVVHRELRRHG